MAVPNEAWPTSKDDYELHEVIGTGATATVQIAFCKRKNEKVAIKRIDLDKTILGIDEVIKEVNEGKSNGSVLDEVTIATILKEVLKGIEYVHQNQYIHRDVKASNILLGEDGSIVLSDFGVSGVLFDTSEISRKQKTRRTFVGTPCWMAPEVLEQVVGYNEKADIWSFGITAIELAVGKDPPTLDDCLLDGDQSKYSKAFKKLIEKCLNKDPSQRPSASELRKNAFFNKAKDRQWIMDNLIKKGPPTQKRAQKVKRVPGTSGRLHKTPSGWEWSDDEYDEEQKGGSGPETANNGQEGKPSSPTEAGQADQLPISHEEYQRTLQETWGKFGNVEAKGGVSTYLTSKIREILDKLSLETKLTKETIQRLWDINKSIGDIINDNRLPTQLSMNIRMRNNDQRLNDIQFPFIVGTDTPSQLASELVGAGHINSTSASSVAESIQYIIDFYPVCKKNNFKMLDIGLPSDNYDENKLIGYGCVSAT